MKLISVRVDATTGVQVSRGTKVEKGQVIGLDPYYKGVPVLSPLPGRVQYISFDADSHTLIISIKTEGTGGDKEEKKL